MASADRIKLGVGVKIFRPKTIADQNLATRDQQRSRFGQGNGQWDVLEAFGKQTQIKAAIAAQLFKETLMHNGLRGIDAAPPCQIGGGHDDFHTVPQSDQLFRRLARAAANIKNAQVGARRQKGKQARRIGLLCQTDIASRHIKASPQPIVQMFLARQPTRKRQARIKADGPRVDFLSSHRTALNETSHSPKGCPACNQGIMAS